MPTGHHTPIADNADINCATFNSPLSELDEAVEELKAAVEELKVEALLAGFQPTGVLAAGRYVVNVASDGTVTLVAE